MALLDYFVAVAPYIGQLMLEDCHFCIADTEKFIVSIPGKRLKMAIQVGDPIREGSLTGVALKEKRRIVRPGNKELYGVAHNAVCLPLLENGKAVGCISIGIATEKYDRIAQAAQSLAAMVEQISAGAQLIASASQQLASVNEKMSDLSLTVKEKMENISEVTQLVSHVSSQTNLLGLNASIQAAHAGEHGKGFSVVAGEIRNLAERSGNATKKIDFQLKEIQSLAGLIAENIQILRGLARDNAAATEELAASIQELNHLAQQLSDMSVFRDTGPS